MKKGLDAEGETKKASHPIDRGAPAVRRIEDASVSTCRITYLGTMFEYRFRDRLARRRALDDE